MTTTLAFARRAAAAVLLAVLLLLALPASPSGAQPGSAAVPFATTNGNVLASLVIPAPDGGQALAITGNFTTVTSPGGVRTAARNFAVLVIPSGKVLFTSPLNSYGRALAYGGHRLYVGGDFTSAGGHPRARVASFSTVTWGLSGFNPTAPARVWALAFVPQRNQVVVGSSLGLRAARPDTATVLWTLPASGGPVRALLMYPGQPWLYVGGLFEQIGPRAQHGLVKLVLPVTGPPQVDTVFAPVLVPDSGVGPRGGDDGQAVLSLAWKLPDYPLLVGWGGARTNGVMAISQVNGHVWWTHGQGVTVAGTPGDVQALAGLPDSVLVGYHRNHFNTTPEPWLWNGSAVEPSSGRFLSWDPRVTGLTSANVGDSNPGGITTFAVDTVNRLLFAGGGFRWWGASCPPDVYPCVHEQGTPSQSLAVWRW